LPSLPPELERLFPLLRSLLGGSGFSGGEANLISRTGAESASALRALLSESGATPELIRTLDQSHAPVHLTRQLPPPSTTDERWLAETLSNYPALAPSGPAPVPVLRKPTDPRHILAPAPEVASGIKPLRRSTAKVAERHGLSVIKPEVRGGKYGTELTNLIAYERMQAAHTSLLATNNLHQEHIDLHRANPLNPALHITTSDGALVLNPDLARVVKNADLIHPNRDSHFRLGSALIPSPLTGKAAYAAELEPQLRSMVNDALAQGDHQAAEMAAETYLRFFHSDAERSRLAAPFRKGGGGAKLSDLTAQPRGTQRHDSSTLGEDLLRESPNQEFPHQPPTSILINTGPAHSGTVKRINTGEPATFTEPTYGEAYWRRRHAATEMAPSSTPPASPSQNLDNPRTSVQLPPPKPSARDLVLRRVRTQVQAQSASDLTQVQRHYNNPSPDDWAPRPRAPKIDSYSGGNAEANLKANFVLEHHHVIGAPAIRAPGKGEKPYIHRPSTEDQHAMVWSDNLKKQFVPFDMDLPARLRITPPVSNVLDVLNGQDIPQKIALAILHNLDCDTSSLPRHAMDGGRVASTILRKAILANGIPESSFIRAVLESGYDGVQLKAVGHGPKHTAIEKRVIWASREHVTLSNTPYAKR